MGPTAGIRRPRPLGLSRSNSVLTTSAWPAEGPSVTVIPPPPGSDTGQGSGIPEDSQRYTEQANGNISPAQPYPSSSMPRDWYPGFPSPMPLAVRSRPRPPILKGDVSAIYKTIPVDEMVQRDEAMVEAQKKQLDTLLVFAGLLSAALTAFNVEVYPMLLPGPNGDTSVAILVQISAQLASFSASGSYINSTQPPVSMTDTATTEDPDVWQILLNLLWSLSMILSFSAASIAIVVKQWLDQYGIGLTDKSRRSKLIRLRRYKGFISYKIEFVIMLVPVLLQTSLVLFFAGLLQLLWILHPLITIVATGVTAILFSFLIVTTILPSLVNDCPFRSPQSYMFLQAVKGFKSVLVRASQTKAPSNTSTAPLPRTETVSSPGPVPSVTHTPYMERIIAEGGRYTWEEEEKSYLSATSAKDAELLMDRLLDNAVDSRGAIAHLKTVLQHVDSAQAVHCFLPLARKYAELPHFLPQLSEIAVDTIARIADIGLAGNPAYYEPLRQALRLARRNLYLIPWTQRIAVIEDSAKIACKVTPVASLAFNVVVDLLYTFAVVELTPDGLRSLWTSLRVYISLPQKRLSLRMLQVEYTMLVLHRLGYCLEYLRWTNQTNQADKLCETWCAELPDILNALGKLCQRISRPSRMMVPDVIKRTRFAHKLAASIHQIMLGDEWPAFCRLQTMMRVPLSVQLISSAVQMATALRCSSTLEPGSWSTFMAAILRFASDIKKNTTVTPLDADASNTLDGFMTSLELLQELPTQQTTTQPTMTTPISQAAYTGQNLVNDPPAHSVRQSSLPPVTPYLPPGFMPYWFTSEPGLNDNAEQRPAWNAAAQFLTPTSSSTVRLRESSLHGWQSSPASTIVVNHNLAPSPADSFLSTTRRQTGPARATPVPGRVDRLPTIPPSPIPPDPLSSSDVYLGAQSAGTDAGSPSPESSDAPGQIPSGSPETKRVLSDIPMTPPPLSMYVAPELVPSDTGSRLASPQDDHTVPPTPPGRISAPTLAEGSPLSIMIYPLSESPLSFRSFHSEDIIVRSPSPPRASIAPAAVLTSGIPTNRQIEAEEESLLWSPPDLHVNPNPDPPTSPPGLPVRLARPDTINCVACDSLSSASLHSPSSASPHHYLTAPSLVQTDSGFTDVGISTPLPIALDDEHSQAITPRHAGECTDTPALLDPVPLPGLYAL